MAVGAFSDTNLATGAAISAPAGGWSALWPVANLLIEERYLAAPARCLTPTDLTRSRFQLLFPEPTIVRLMALFFTTLSRAARYRLTFTTLADTAFAAPVQTVGWNWVYPSLYDPEDLLFGASNFWDGAVLETDLDLYRRHVWMPVPEVLCERVRVEVDDQTNAAGFFDIGGAFATSGFSPQINFDRGRDLSVRARDLVDQTPSGRRIFERRSPERELAVSWSNLSDAEAFRFVDAAMRARSAGAVVFVPNLDDQGSLMREAFPANFSKLPGARTSWSGLGASAITLTEILA